VASALDLAVAGKRSAKSKAEPRSLPGVFEGLMSRDVRPSFFAGAAHQWIDKTPDSSKFEDSIPISCAGTAPSAEADHSRPGASYTGALERSLPAA
jgi:hypothetical protein